jgi:hypothetical protein
MFKEAWKVEDQELKNPLESVLAESRFLDGQLLNAGKKAWLSQQEISQTLEDINTNDIASNTIEYKEAVEWARKEVGMLKTSALISATNLNKETWIIDTQNIMQLPIYNT